MTTKRRPLAFTVLAVALLVVPLLEILAIIQDYLLEPLTE